MSRCLPNPAGSGIMLRMSTLVDIEQAAVKLPAEEQQQLLRFLLRVVPVNEAELPGPRIFSRRKSRAGSRKIRRVCAASARGRDVIAGPMSC